MAKYKGKCPYCEYVVEDIDYKTVQVALRDHILEKHKEEIHKKLMENEKMKKARDTKSLKWFAGYLASFCITEKE